MKTHKLHNKVKFMRSRKRKLKKRSRKLKKRSRRIKGGGGSKKCYINWQCPSGECCEFGTSPFTYGFGFSDHTCQPCSTSNTKKVNPFSFFSRLFSS